MRAECLVCFTTRQVLLEGCDHTLRWVGTFRELRSPTATGLEKRVASCDCATLERWTLGRHLLVRDVRTDELEQPPEAPRCAGVGATSTHPCANWERVRRQPTQNPRPPNQPPRSPEPPAPPDEPPLLPR